MTEKEEAMYKAIHDAVLETVEKIGIEAVRQLSMFPSADYWQKLKDGDTQSIVLEALEENCERIADGLIELTAAVKTLPTAMQKAFWSAKEG